MRTVPCQAVRFAGTFKRIEHRPGIWINLGDNVRVGVRTPQRCSIPSNPVWSRAGRGKFCQDLSSFRGYLIVPIRLHISAPQRFAIPSETMWTRAWWWK
ncbi:MAG: hypothetical protein MJE68_28535 [Proteobacteria bacterium]|nr:hypothetical protein [Pseudomonadota bacterium]